MNQGSQHLDLALVARLARMGARQAIRDEMDARDRYIPHEVGEAWLQMGVVQGLRQHLRMTGSPRFRVHDEYQDCDIANLDSDYPHLIDVVVLYPATSGATPACPPAVGVIEIRKDVEELQDDVRRLDRMAAGAPAQPPLQWVLEVVLIDGASREQVVERDREAKAVAARYGLAPLTPCEPESAALYPAAVEDGWFDVVCYGRAIGA
jgi:hypothetical protein